MTKPMPDIIKKGSETAILQQQVPLLDVFEQRRSVRLLMFLMGWTAIAVVATTTAFIALRGSSVDLWLTIFQPMAIYYTAWAALSVGIYLAVMRQADSIGARLQTSLILVAVLFCIMGVMPFVAHPEDWQNWMYGDRAVGFHALTLAIFMFIVVGSFTLKYYRQGLHHARARITAMRHASMLEETLNHTRVNMLKMQINPHFMFNALNSIGALVETGKNSEAYRTIELLGAMLHQTLDLSEQTYTSLSNELEVIENYIQLERIRFGERLLYETDVDESTRDFVIPALILQPVIENAIKHGVGRSPSPVTIKLTAHMQDGALSLVVIDDGPGFAADSMPGVGNTNVSRRLALLYGRDDLFRVQSLSAGGVAAHITVPQMRQPHQPD